MNQFRWLFFLLFFLSCGDKKPSLADNKPVEADDFFAAFQKLKLPYDAADTGLLRIGDTTTISYEVLKQFVPDSAIKVPKAGKNTGAIIHPVGKIENKNELYLLLTARAGQNATLFACLFSNNEKKKKEYLNSIPLLLNKNDDNYVHSLDINSEPTFTINREKTVNGQYSFTKKGFAYNSSAKSFIEVMNEGNENAQKNPEIINPVDTLAKTFKYSGDYTKDKTNFISVRDGNMAGRYTFFLHFEKSKGDCTGELKGTLTMINATNAVFQQSGDPCVIDFTFGNNTIKVKERGSCGNHRGITCLFDDSYRKKKEKTPPALRGEKKAH